MFAVTRVTNVLHRLSSLLSKHCRNSRCSRKHSAVADRHYDHHACHRLSGMLTVHSTVIIPCIFRNKPIQRTKHTHSGSSTFNAITQKESFISYVLSIYTCTTFSRAMFASSEAYYNAACHRNTYHFNWNYIILSCNQISTHIRMATATLLSFGVEC